jgi:hypothetical protein
MVIFHRVEVKLFILGAGVILMNTVLLYGSHFPCRLGYNFYFSLLLLSCVVNNSGGIIMSVVCTLYVARVVFMCHYYLQPNITVFMYPESARTPTDLTELVNLNLL